MGRKPQNVPLPHCKNTDHRRAEVYGASITADDANRNKYVELKYVNYCFGKQRLFKY